MRPDGSMIQDHISSIKFDRFPSPRAVKFVYAAESKSGATGETIFNYIATNSVEGDNFKEAFIDPSDLDSGIYNIQVVVADYFGNIASKIISIEVTK